MGTDYRMKIRITDTKLVIAEVFRPDGTRCGLRFFTPWLRTTKSVGRAAGRAEKWAEDYLQMCRKRETR